MPKLRGSSSRASSKRDISADFESSSSSSDQTGGAAAANSANSASFSEAGRLLSVPRQKKKNKTLGYRLRGTVLLVGVFCLALAYIAGDLVFSDAAFKASGATSYLVPYVGKSTAANASDPAEPAEPAAAAAAAAYCASPFYSFDSIFWRAAAAEAGNETVGGGTRPASTTRCTVGTAEKMLRSAHVQQSGTSSSIFFTTLSVKADGNEADHLTSPERFYALNPEYQALGFAVASARVSDGKIVPPTAIYSSTTGKQITTSPRGYGWKTMRDLFADVGLSADVLDTRRNGNATGPTFRESGLSIQVTITMRNYPLTFDEIEPWMAG